MAVITPYSENDHKKGKGTVITIIVIAVIVLLTLGVILAYRLFFLKPEVKLTKGLVHMTAELNSYGSFMAGDLDLETVTKNLVNDAATFDVVMNLTLPQSDTIGIDFTTHYDYADKKMDTDFSVSAYNIDLVEGWLAADGNRLYMSLPELIKDTYCMDTDTLGSDYNASVWPSYLGYSLSEDTSIELFPQLTYYDNSTTLFESINKVMKEGYKTLLKNMYVEDSEDMIEIERDGKTIRCSGVRVTFQEEDMNALFDNLFNSDVELSVYFDKQNRIVSISTPEEVQLKDSKIRQMSFSFLFEGSERAMDYITGTVKLGNEEEAYKLDVERKASVTEKDYDENICVSVTDSESDESMDIIYTNKWGLENQEIDMLISVITQGDHYSCKLKGEFTDVDKEKLLTMNIGDLDFTVNEQSLFHIFGSVSVRPFEEVISIPEDGINLFGLSQEDIENLKKDIYSFILKTYIGL